MSGQGTNVAVQQPQQRTHNRIFEKLIDDAPESEDALVSFVAYVYYKAAKREWVVQFCEQHGRPPNDAELNAYTTTWTDMRLDGLRTEANVALTRFASYVVDQERPKIVEDALKHRSFWREAGVAAVGAALWTLLLIGIAFIAKLAGIDLLHVLERVGK